MDSAAAARRRFLALLGAAAMVPAAARAATLPDLGAAADFALIRETGVPFARRDLLGKVVLVDFIYTGCPDICPLLTQKLAEVQDALGPLFGRDVVFVSITMDPQADTPAVLKDYAESLGCDPAGWAFLTGSADEIARAASAYGVFFARTPSGSIDHNALTSLVDRAGRLRVQYMGTAFDPAELERDLRSLAADAGAT
ncbi:MAG: SCO family protein [Geminicoccaceae bacterium]